MKKCVCFVGQKNDLRVDVVSQQFKSVLGTAAPHLRGTGFESHLFPMQLPTTMYPGEQWVIDHVLESLPPWWETWRQFLAPSCTWPSPVYVGYLGSKPEDGRSECLFSLPFRQILKTLLNPLHHYCLILHAIWRLYLCSNSKKHTKINASFYFFKHFEVLSYGVLYTYAYTMTHSCRYELIFSSSSSLASSTFLFHKEKPRLQGVGWFGPDTELNK